MKKLTKHSFMFISIFMLFAFTACSKFKDSTKSTDSITDPYGSETVSGWTCVDDGVTIKYYFYPDGRFRGFRNDKIYRTGFYVGDASTTCGNIFVVVTEEVIEVYDGNSYSFNYGPAVMRYYQFNIGIDLNTGKDTNKDTAGVIFWNTKKTYDWFTCSRIVE